MRVHFMAVLVLVLGFGRLAFAQDATPTDVTPTPVFPKPVTIPFKDRIPDPRHYGLPHPPAQSFDGVPVTLDNDLDNVPLGQAMADLDDPSVLAQLSSANKADGASQKYYWHPFKSCNYCHVKKDGHDWYGWQTDDAFHWVLWSGERFWWRDDYANRWIYYNQGYWWWQNPHKAGSFQVFLQDGHYHVCSADGVLGDDLMRTGEEEVETEPVSKETPTNGHNWSDGMGGGKEMGARGPAD